MNADETASEETEHQRLQRLVLHAMKLQGTEWRAYAPTPGGVSNALARLLTAATQLGAETYLACTRTKLYGDALSFLTTEFRKKPPYIEELRLAIQSALDDGSIRAHRTGRYGIAEHRRLDEYRLSLAS